MKVTTCFLHWNPLSPLSGRRDPWWFFGRRFFHHAQFIAHPLEEHFIRKQGGNYFAGYHFNEPGQVHSSGSVVSVFAFPCAELLTFGIGRIGIQRDKSQPTALASAGLPFGSTGVGGQDNLLTRLEP